MAQALALQAELAHPALFAEILKNQCFEAARRLEMEHWMAFQDGSHLSTRTILHICAYTCHENLHI